MPAPMAAVDGNCHLLRFEGVNGRPTQTRRRRGDTNMANQRRPRRSAARFLATFVVLFAAFQVSFIIWLLPSEAFHGYLDVCARGGALALRCLGRDVTATDGTIASGATAIQIKAGCDALQPCAIFASGVMAFPAPLVSKLLALICGSSALLAINFVRIVTLFELSMADSTLFQLSHEVFWPAAFVLFAVGFVVLWTRAVLRKSEERR